MAPVLIKGFEKLALISLVVTSAFGVSVGTSNSPTAPPDVAMNRSQSTCVKEVGAGSWLKGDGCNICWCVGDGIVACTQEVCNTTCETLEGPKEVGEKWPAGDGCNECRCQQNGLVSCTKRLCPTLTCKTPQGVKQKGEKWEAEDGCNRCRCLSNGLIRCTNKICRKQYCETPDGRREKGERWTAADGCNRCKCMRNGLVKCNQRLCANTSPNDPVEVSECQTMQGTKQVHDVWFAQDECNRCMCMSDGTVLCTTTLLCEDA